MKPQVKYGLMVAGTGILISLILFVAGLDKSDAGQYLQWINIIFLILGMVWTIKAYRDNEGKGFITFGQAFKVAFVVALISSVIISIYTYFYMTSINPSIREYMVEKQAEKMQEQGLSQEQIDQAMSMSEKFMSPGIMIAFVIVGGAFYGAIIALIIAAIMKKPNPDPFAGNDALDNPGRVV